MLQSFDGLVWLLLLLGPLLFSQRWLHREVQSIFLLLTRRIDLSVILFSILFFPGVVLHESSHFFMALLLGVRTGKFSLWPDILPNGRLRLGYVETAAVDPLREGLIGAAPLLSGGLFVAFIGLERLNLHTLWGYLLAGGPASILSLAPQLINRPDFWLWFYLAFTVSATMMPSASDRRAWLPLSLLTGLLLGFSLLAGAGPWLLMHVAEPLNWALRSAAVVLAVSLFFQALLLLPLWGIRWVLNRLTGLQITR
jgi:hypothetical protein